MGISADDMIDGLAEIIATKVAEKLAAGGTTTSEPPAEATPADTADQPGAAPKRRGRPPKAAAAAPEAEAEAEAEEAPAEGDQPTDAQKEFVEKNFQDDSVELDRIKEDLKAFYVASGCDEAEVDSTLAENSEEVLRQDYKEYMARLVSQAGGKMDFLADYDTPYPAARVAADGTETVVWVKGGLTMSEEDVTAADLGSAEEAAQKPKPKPVPKAASKPLPGKKTTPPGKK